MRVSSLRLRVLGTGLILSVLASCAAPPPPPQPPPQEFAGAWFQVYFDTGSVALNDRAKRIFDRIAAAISKDATARVTVIGKTDRVGDRPANWVLSEHRAEAVRNALIADGVPADRIDTSWTGERRQAVATADGVDEARNRVVDITVTKPPPG